jgi:hypothetical protein
MHRRTDLDSSPNPECDPAATPPTPRQSYETPVLEHLGSWRALTLEQSVSITWIRLRDSGYSPDDVWWWNDGQP